MSDKEGRKEFPFVSSVFRWFWRDLVKCYLSVQVTYLLDLCFLKPDCSGQRILLFSRNHISLWFTILSNNLQMQLVSEIGQ